VSKLVFAASLMAALVLAACGAPTPAPSQPSVSAPPSSPVQPAPDSPAPSTPADPATPVPTDPPVATPAPTVKPTTKPTTKPTFTRAERYLVDGIMRGEGECHPVRGNALPGLAIAGIDCDLVGSPVARAGYYLFKNDEDMLDAYMARVTVENLVVDSGACAPGEGEGAYIPYGDDEFAPDRHACYVNDQGYGNYRATLSGTHVYVGLLGRSSSMRALEDWAWFGSQDVPGNPTLWSQSFVYKP
jgi:hypothetical protein